MKEIYYGISIIIISTLLIFPLFSNTVPSCDTIGPIRLKVVAGCNVGDCFEIYNSGETGTFVINYNISEPEGINFTIPSSIVINRHSKGTICFDIQTSILLSPGEYYIDITLYRTIEKEKCNLNVQAWHSSIVHYKNSYFKVKVSGDHQLNGVYRGWCIDLGSTMKDGRTYTASSTTNVNNISLVEYPENMDLVNWILNHHYIGQEPAGNLSGRYTYGDVQKAIWALLDDRQSSSFIGLYSALRVGRIVWEAKHSGEGFVPKNGDITAIILKPCDLKKAQICIIEVPVGTWNSYIKNSYVQST